MRNKGFTLIENIIMLLVVTVISLAILELNIQNINIYKNSNDNYVMFLIAKSICEIYTTQDNIIPEGRYLFYLDDTEDLKETIEECSLNLALDNTKRYNVFLNFEQISCGLNKMTVNVISQKDNKQITLSCYK